MHNNDSMMPRWNSKILLGDTCKNNMRIVREHNIFKHCLCHHTHTYYILYANMNFFSVKTPRLHTCLHKITINRMVMLMIRAINDRTVSGTVKLNDNISKLMRFCFYFSWRPVTLRSRASYLLSIHCCKDIDDKKVIICLRLHLMLSLSLENFLATECQKEKKETHRKSFLSRKG